MGVVIEIMSNVFACCWNPACQEWDLAAWRWTVDCQEPGVCWEQGWCSYSPFFPLQPILRRLPGDGGDAVADRCFHASPSVSCMDRRLPSSFPGGLQPACCSSSPWKWNPHGWSFHPGFDQPAWGYGRPVPVVWSDLLMVEHRLASCEPPDGSIYTTHIYYVLIMLLEKHGGWGTLIKLIDLC